MIWVKEVPGNPPNRCKIGRVSQKCLPMIVTSRGFTEGHDNTPCTLVSIHKQDTRYGGFMCAGRRSRNCCDGFQFAGR